MLGVVSDGFGLIERAGTDRAPIGHVSVKSVTEHATFASWIEELRKSDEPEAQRIAGKSYSPAELDMLGTLVRLDVSLDDAQDRLVSLKWSLLDTRLRPLAEPGFAGREARVFKPDAVRRSGVIPTWVPSPHDDGRYVVRYELWDEAGVQLDSVDTAPVTIIGTEGL